MSPIWLRTLKTLITKGRWPSPRRRAIWRARAEFARAAGRLGPGDVAIDCGANVGRYTRLLARNGAEVHAFEPDPVAFEALGRAMAGHQNVTLHRAAVGAEAGRVTLYRAAAFAEDPVEHSVSSSVFADKGNVDAAAAVEVEQIDLAEFLSRFPRVALLKLDIEGAEVPVLERLLETGLLDRIGCVMVETHEAKVPALAERTAALRQRLAAEGRAGVNLDWA